MPDDRALGTVVPARVFDSGPAATVDGIGSNGGRRAAGTTTTIQVAGRGGVPSDATGAVINVAAINTGAAGFLTIYPCDSPRPEASTLNYSAGRRSAGSTTTIQVAGRSGVPAGADAAVINVVAINAAAPGFLTIYPCGAARPEASTLNYAAGQTIANGATVKLGSEAPSASTPTRPPTCSWTSAATSTPPEAGHDCGSGDGPRPPVATNLNPPRPARHMQWAIRSVRWATVCISEMACSGLASIGPRIGVSIVRPASRPVSPGTGRSRSSSQILDRSDAAVRVRWWWTTD